MARGFEDLKCWIAARDLVKSVYEATSGGKFSSDYNMKDQIRRASISSMSNVAEGFGRISNKEFIRFLTISSSSASEVKSLAYAAVDLGYWDTELAAMIQAKADDVRSLDHGFIRYLKSKKD